MLDYIIQEQTKLTNAKSCAFHKEDSQVYRRNNAKILETSFDGEDNSYLLQFPGQRPVWTKDTVMARIAFGYALNIMLDIVKKAVIDIPELWYNPKKTDSL